LSKKKFFKKRKKNRVSTSLKPDELKPFSLKPHELVPTERAAKGAILCQKRPNN
jgi:hypothetical protein